MRSSPPESAQIGGDAITPLFFGTLRARLPGAIDPVAVYSDALNPALVFSIISFGSVALLVWKLPMAAAPGDIRRGG